MEKLNLVINKINNKVLLNGEIVGESFLMGRQHYLLKRIRDNRYNSILMINKVDNFKNIKIANIFNHDIDLIIIPFKDNLDNYFNNIFIKSHLTFKKSSRGLELVLLVSPEKWTFDFSLKLFTSTFLESLLLNKKFLYRYDLRVNGNLIQEGVPLYRFAERQKDIVSLFYETLSLFKQQIESTISDLIQETNLNLQNLSNTFKFPPEIQSSCEQYLIYFATFLKDIGINAETNIESKAHETLFTVTPKDGKEALDKIKEALQVYLKLPESPDFESIASEFTDVGVHQLVSQVHFLKSQLALGKTMIQMKDATIEALQLTNYQQKEIIQSHQTNEKNEEELAGGLVKANEVKVIGLTFDLPELLRRIKRKFT